MTKFKRFFTAMQESLDEGQKRERPLLTQIPRALPSSNISWNLATRLKARDWPRIPPAFLTATKKFRAPELPEAPLIAFINSRSGGRAGPKLTDILYRTLGHAQARSLSQCHTLMLCLAR